MSPAEILAPCVAITGPPNSGKTTLLHLLDEALQLDPARPSVYVVKGNPDGTGRYLHYSRELRSLLKEEVKGRWVESTVDQICEWVTQARRNLELVLLDFGGKHAPDNHRMLKLCSHYIVLARRFEDAVKEKAEGADSWRAECEGNGLEPVAIIQSLWQQGRCAVTHAGPGAIEGTLRSDASQPGDQTNAPLIAALVERLLEMRVQRPAIGGIDLRLERDWNLSDLATMAGLLANIQALARANATLQFSGRAPIWAYVAAMHRALSIQPQAELQMFDPKVEGGWVRIPPKREARAGFPEGTLEVEWRKSELPGFCEMHFSITTADKFLPDAAWQALAGAPWPEPSAPPCLKVVVSGAGPIWLHMTYSRWLRSFGVETIAIWDARNTTRSCRGAMKPNAAWGAMLSETHVIADFDSLAGRRHFGGRFETESRHADRAGN